MSKDMGREELLQELAYLDQAEYINKQAYAQLKAIVEQHFSPTEQVIRGITVQMVEGALASKEIADTEQSPEPGVDEKLIELLTICEKQLKANLYPHCSREQYKERCNKLNGQFSRIRQLLTQQPQEDWTPTAENINSLPKGMKDYIYGIETNCDPQWVIRENRLMKDLIKQLEAKLLTQQKRAVTRDELQELIYICGDIEGQLMPFKEVVDWFKDRDIEVTTKK